MISAAGVRPTWLVLLRGFIQPQWTSAIEISAVTRAHLCFVGQVEVFGRQVLKALPLQM